MRQCFVNYVQAIRLSGPRMTWFRYNKYLGLPYIGMKNIVYVIPLMLVGFCLTAQTAYATNESSYKLGLKYGHDEFQKCDTACLNLDALGVECQTSPHVDNVTVCNDGYVHAWIHEGGHTLVAACIISGHTWDAGQCQSGKLVAVSGPTVCHEESGNQVCEAGIGQVANTNVTSNMTR